MIGYLILLALSSCATLAVLKPMLYPREHAIHAAPEPTFVVPVATFDWKGLV